ncbi:MAG: hypothetical protein HY023_06645 [Chloroflexi bacterium]|nr:hypothetical protein [Chloroflexota bacterium]MBI3763106.1 hypothetical protein [Chloroflexota bacterium]
MTLEEIVSDIWAMEENLSRYERKYGLRSTQFFELYRAGRLRDEEPAEVHDYGDWAACYDIKLDRERRYDEMIRQRLAEIGGASVSLRDILPGRRAVPTLA